MISIYNDDFAAWVERDQSKDSNGLIKRFDCIITDPPYPDYHTNRYDYYEGMIKALDRFPCRQFVFWSAKVDFPLSYTAVHIWDKKVGAGSQYERIFERNGGKECKVFRYYLINSTVAASYGGDIFTGHPSQKPIKLIKRLVVDYTKPEELLLDPFAGSGTLGVAALQLRRNAVLIEKDQDFYAMARERVLVAQQQMMIQFEE